jgi:isopenicillin N synthase-like dioxygenase
VHHYYAPSYEHCALRVLEYPPGAGSHEHTDFNLFTLMLYRNQPDKFVHDGRDHIPPSVRKLNEQCHLGEITEILGTGPATKHSVLPSETTQVSAVFFAIPNHEAVLPNGMKVGDWIAERVSRSRYDK